MNLQSGFAALGALLPIGAILGIHFGLGEDWIMLAIVAGLVIISYIIAAATATSGFGEFMRGWLIGLNSGLNSVALLVIFHALVGIEAGIIAAVAVGILNLLCVFAPISQNGFFQGVIGWLNWAMPMSWLVVSLGFALYVFSFLLFFVTFGQVDYLKIKGLGMDWATGTFFIKGGLIANMNPIDTAFNMGNFSFVDHLSGAWHKEHEAGHTLNLAAFGSVFHFIGALDENVFGRGHNAYAERLAESNSSGSGGGNIPMWA